MFRVTRSSSSASWLVRLIAASELVASSAASPEALVLMTCSAISACSWIADRPWPTTSCTSRATRSRSSSAWWRAHSARLRATLSPCSRSVTPIANGSTIQADPGTMPSMPALTPEPTNTWICRNTSATPEA
jgi:hypothetical protein